MQWLESQPDHHQSGLQYPVLPGIHRYSAVSSPGGVSVTLAVEVPVEVPLEVSVEPGSSALVVVVTGSASVTSLAGLLSLEDEESAMTLPLLIPSVFCSVLLASVVTDVRRTVLEAV